MQDTLALSLQEATVHGRNSRGHRAPETATGRAGQEIRVGGGPWTLGRLKSGVSPSPCHGWALLRVQISGTRCPLHTPGEALKPSWPGT